MKPRTPRFVEHQADWNAYSGYNVTNEEPQLFNIMLKDIKVQKAGCIAAGGEVLLTVLLNRAVEIIAVDHSYQSLIACWTKLLLLQKLSSSELIELLRKEDYNTIKTHVATLQQLPLTKAMPDTLKDAWPTIRREWCAGEFKIPRISKSSIDKLTFVHSDLRQLQAVYGTFDLFYASNAMEHSGKDGTCPKLSDLLQLLNPGGLLLYTSNYNDSQKIIATHLVDLVAQMRGVRTSWWYTIVRKRE